MTTSGPLYTSQRTDTSWTIIETETGNALEKRQGKAAKILIKFSSTGKFDDKLDLLFADFHDSEFRKQFVNSNFPSYFIFENRVN